MPRTAAQSKTALFVVSAEELAICRTLAAAGAVFAVAVEEKPAGRIIIRSNAHSWYNSAAFSVKLLSSTGSIGKGDFRA